MYILNIFSAIKKVTIKELKDFTHKNYYTLIGFLRENSYCSIKNQTKNVIVCN